jgi:hypothetical protein
MSYELGPGCGCVIPYTLYPYTLIAIIPSFLIVHCSLFTAHCSLFTANCSLSPPYPTPPGK